jgi:drug/metabolite transporter (DMT)-like permease
MGEGWGVLAAVVSSGLGGSSIGATRYLAGVIDPLALGSFRFGIGSALLLPIAIWQNAAWPPRRDWPRVAGLGILFFGLFPILFNASLIFTTAARGALALSTLPVLTMVIGAALRVEPLTPRKTIGVVISMLGVAIALLSGFAFAPPGAWLGDLLMIAAAFCMAFYNVWSRPFIRRSGAIPFTAMGMAAGAACLIFVSWLRGSFAPVLTFGAPQWLAIVYLGVLGSALTFYLWVFALERTTPTRVAVSVTVNPVTASLAGLLLLGEAVRWNLIVGIVTVFLGIRIATNSKEKSRHPFPSPACGEG